MKKQLLLIGLAALLTACNTDETKTVDTVDTDAEPVTEVAASAGTEVETEVTETEVKAETDTTSAAEAGYGYMHEDVELNGVAYQVTEIMNNPTVAGYTSESGTYLGVKVKVTNNTNTAVTVSNRHFKIYSNKALYDHEPTVTTYHDGGFFEDKVNPGMSKTATVLFEVPNDFANYPAMVDIKPNQYDEAEAYILLGDKP